MHAYLERSLLVEDLSQVLDDTKLHNLAHLRHTEECFGAIFMQ